MRGLLHRSIHLLPHTRDARRETGRSSLHSLGRGFPMRDLRHPDRPKVCDDFKADPDVCGTSREEALILLDSLEKGSP